MCTNYDRYITDKDLQRKLKKLNAPLDIDDDITEEIVAVDKKTFYMISDEIYVGEDKVFDLKIDIDGVNTNPPAADFEV